jgi:hypothetical protein
MATMNRTEKPRRCWGPDHDQQPLGAPRSVAAEEAEYTAEFEREQGDATMATETTRTGKWYLAPATAPTDPYAAGYDGNVFDTESEALAAVDGLRELGDEWDHEWVARQY